MTHDELLDSFNTLPSEQVTPAIKALRAVVELHKDYTTAEGIKFCVICTRTEDKWEYPCSTIQAIEKELQ